VDPVNDEELFPDEVREVVPLLAPYAFNQLDAEDRSRVEEALASSELVRILNRDLAEAAAALGEADPARIDDHTEPPPELEQRILSAARRRTPRWTPLAAAAACLALLVGGFVVITGDDPPPVPRESFTFAAPPEGLEVLQADLIAHTWGTEVEFVVDGWRDDVTYTVAFVDQEGNRVDAGSFIGVADRPVNCRMNAALLREDATGLVILAPGDEIVLEADLS